MPPLIEHILSLEQQANGIVQAAHEEAAAIAKRAETDAENERRRIQAATDQRLAAYREQAEEGFRAELARADAEFEAACRAIDAMSDASLKPYVDRVLARIEEV